jgi:hypothetical protein
MERSLRISAVLLLASFAVELLTLFSAHPAAFIAFVGVGGLLLAGGVGIYLLTLLRGLVLKRVPQEDSS